MKLNDLVASMSGYLSEQTIVDFIMFSKAFDDARYSVLKTKAIDKVSIALLAAAKNSELFYDVVQWGEDNGIASKATFSRRKDFLVNLNVIQEESVKTPFGRPKIRLKLNEKKLSEYFGVQPESS
ncbi:hypothetical protein CUJ83_14480 [Methanocella sp. CWC-04]|uniref:Transcriptional regulator TbsP-like C-terminal domain-containing protein n=1 Tax=Methanooceanicella nereidis TaxID=2052831 RepID=A0AAP2REK5_9EURY|nr:DUF5821 family protein [Methanocella sp. CWC-04]MCD1296206.1 hypothetical protein [Methanocella sp. CWC-04]